MASRPRVLLVGQRVVAMGARTGKMAMPVSDGRVQCWLWCNQRPGWEEASARDEKRAADCNQPRGPIDARGSPRYCVLSCECQVRRNVQAMASVCLLAAAECGQPETDERMLGMSERQQTLKCDDG